MSGAASAVAGGGGAAAGGAGAGAAGTAVSSSFLLGYPCPSWLLVVISILGLYTALRFAFATLDYVWLHYLRPRPDFTKYGARKNAKSPATTWSVVTGATAGIGEGFCQVLAARGFNVVLISRDETKLRRQAQRLERDFKVQTQIVVIDCAKAGADEFDVLQKVIEPLDVSLLVNNVGINTTVPNELDAHTEQELDGMIAVNARFHTKFTRLIIPLMKRRFDKSGSSGNSSAILHLSSFSGLFPAALMPVYSATKSYVDAFALALAPELAPYQIESISVVAHYVVSSMSGFDRPSMSVPTAHRFARDTLNKLGAGPRLIPYWHHDLYARFVSLLPMRLVLDKGYDMMKRVRAALLDPERARRRAERKARSDQLQKDKDQQRQRSSPAPDHHPAARVAAPLSTPRR